jgi:preprotein translocase SecF subunit
MIQLFSNPSYDFIGKRKWAYVVSAVVLLGSLVSLVVQGLRYDVDFTGGTLVQVRFEQAPSVERMRAALARVGYADAVIQQFGGPNEFIARLPLKGSGSSQEVGQRIQNVLGADASLGKFEIRRVEFVGPQVGKELQRQAIYAVLAGLAGILIYIAMRFDLKGGVAAVLAVFHDVLVCLGALSITHREFSLPVLAALLTIIGYSVNDTIVAYDRLRENRAKPAQRGRSFALQMNDAVNQTLSRTILTALTVFFSAVILLVFGGKVLEDFAFVLTVGVITGTYSTTYIAAALVVDWTLRVEGRLRRSPGSRGSTGTSAAPPPGKKAAAKAQAGV